MYILQVADPSGVSLRHSRRLKRRRYISKVSACMIMFSHCHADDHRRDPIMCGTLMEWTSCLDMGYASMVVLTGNILIPLSNN